VFREWYGRRSAETRIAHLVCGVLVRMRAVGLANGLRSADHACGTRGCPRLATVRVNRSLQELRGKRLITLRVSILNVEDWEGPKGAGEFDPTYLHLDGDAARTS
jgi:hypothetical protein